MSAAAKATPIPSPKSTGYRLIDAVKAEHLLIRDPKAPHNDILDHFLSGATVDHARGFARLVESFNNRPDRVARWYPEWDAEARTHRDKLSWKPHKAGGGQDPSDYAALSRAHSITHLLDGRGQFSPIGVYTPADDGTVRWFGWDIDGGPEHKVVGGEDDILRLRDALGRLAIPYVLETSKSAHGWHAWVFPREPVPAALARRLSVAVLREAGLREDTEFFPKSDVAMQTGNLLGLFGSAYFMSHKGGTLVHDERTMEPVPLVSLVSYVESKKTISEQDILSAIESVDSRLVLTAPTASSASATNTKLTSARPSRIAPDVSPNNKVEKDVFSFLAAFNWPVERTKQTPKGLRISVPCPNEATHSSDNQDDSAVLVAPGGLGLGFGCRHAHCTNIRWAQFRAHLDPLGSWKFFEGDGAVIDFGPVGQEYGEGVWRTGREPAATSSTPAKKREREPGEDEPDGDPVKKKEPRLPRFRAHERELLRAASLRRDLSKPQKTIALYERAIAENKARGGRDHRSEEEEIESWTKRQRSLEECLRDVSSCGTVAERRKCPVDPANHKPKLVFHACERDCCCPSCSESRARVLDYTLLQDWGANWERVCLVVKRYPAAPGDRSIVQGQRNQLLDRLNKTKLPCRWIEGYEHVVAVGPQELAEEITFDLGLDIYDSDVGEAVKFFMDTYRAPAKLLHEMVREAANPKTAPPRKEKLLGDIINFPFASGTRVPRTRANRPGKEITGFPWPDNKAIRKNAALMANARRPDGAPTDPLLCDAGTGVDASGQRTYCCALLSREVIDVLSGHVLMPIRTDEHPDVVGKEMERLAGRLRDEVGFGPREILPEPEEVFILDRGRPAAIFVPDVLARLAPRRAFKPPPRRPAPQRA